MNLEQAVTILPTPAALVARDTRRADEVTTTLKQLDSQSASVCFDQGDLFVEVDREAHWMTLGHESAEEYYRSLNIDISKREILYRAKVSRTMATLGLTRADYAPARLSKLKIITELDVAGQIVDPDTEIAEPLAPIMVRLIQAAPLKKLSEIREEVDILLGKTGDEDSELTWLNLPIRRDAKQVVLDAIELARVQSGDTIDVNSGELKDISDAAALERISADYLADPNNQADELGTPGQFEDSVGYDNGERFSEDGDTYDIVNHDLALEPETEE
jgi:hypothetical protein